MDNLFMLGEILREIEDEYAKLSVFKNVIADSSTINGETMDSEEEKILKEQLLKMKNTLQKLFKINELMKLLDVELKNKNVEVKDATNNLGSQNRLVAIWSEKNSIMDEIDGLIEEFCELQNFVYKQLSKLEKFLYTRRKKIEEEASSYEMPNDQNNNEFVPQETNGVESDCTHEVLRLQEAYLYIYFLSRFQEKDVCDDFLKGKKGATKLTHTQLSQLKELFKLIVPGKPTEQSDVDSHCYELAENTIFLIHGSDKEIAGTTYKNLNELLIEIEECGYFSGCSYSGEDSDLVPDMQSAPQETNSVESNCTTESAIRIQTESESCIIEPVEPSASPQNAPFQEVLKQQGSFNFLQESQIDLEAPHMDPAMLLLLLTLKKMAIHVWNLLMLQYPSQS